MTEIESVLLAEKYLQASKHCELHGDLHAAHHQAELAIVALKRWQEAIQEEIERRK